LRSTRTTGQTVTAAWLAKTVAEVVAINATVAGRTRRTPLAAIHAGQAGLPQQVELRQAGRAGSEIEAHLATRRAWSTGRIVEEVPVFAVGTVSEGADGTSQAQLSLCSPPEPHQSHNDGHSNLHDLNNLK
jgi:hypothetical protein